jgi:mRNA interferase RelE/StbE
MNQLLKYRLKVTEKTAGLIQALHPHIKTTIRTALKAIIDIDKPYSGKALKDELVGLRSYRVKRFRIVYRVDPKSKQIDIVVIGPRKTIYEETFKLIQKEQL